MLIFEKEFQDEKKFQLEDKDLYEFQWDKDEKELWICFKNNKKKICRFGNLNIRYKNPVKPEFLNDLKYAKDLLRPKIEKKYLVLDTLEVYSIYKNDLEENEGISKIKKNLEIKVLT